MTKLGIVLSGGGAKGAYEIGVLVALRRLHKKYDIVTGTSIGALNGLFAASNSLRKAVRVWRKINFGMIYDEKAFTACPDDSIISIYKEYAKNFINEGGLDVSKIENVIDKYFNYKKFIRSNINYGLVTYNLSKLTPKLMTKKDLKEDNIKNYVIASASCFPAFKPKKIGKDLYIDGGYYDNMPINLAISLGAEEIIAVDLRAVGFKRETKNKGVPITIISPRNNIGSFLVFDKKQSVEAMKFGYNDALKKFKKLDGNLFTFKKGSLVKNYDKYNELFNSVLYGVLKTDNDLIDKLANYITHQKLTKRPVTYLKFNSILEDAGKLFNFNESTIYNINSYNKGLLSEIYKTESFSLTDIKEKVQNKKLLDLVSKRKIVKLFFLSLLNNNISALLKLIPVFYDEFLISVYLYTINGNKTSY